MENGNEEVSEDKSMNEDVTARYGAQKVLVFPP